MSQYVRYEVIFVEYDDGEYLAHLLKIRNDGEGADGELCEYLDSALVLSLEDANTLLSETLRHGPNRKSMTIEEYREYLDIIDF